jgi:chorismate mutase/prephenate dehydratase
MSAPNRPGAVHSSAGTVRQTRRQHDEARIATRPTGLWEYLFYVDLAGHESDPPVAAALAELRKKPR